MFRDQGQTGGAVRETREEERGITRQSRLAHKRLCMRIRMYACASWYSEGLLDSTYFPASDSEKEAHHIGLLLLLKLFDILEGTHFG